MSAEGAKRPDRNVVEQGESYIGQSIVRPQAARLLAGRAEAAVSGRRPDAAALAEAGRALDADLAPPGDVHASAALRRHLAGVLLARALSALTAGG